MAGGGERLAPSAESARYVGSIRRPTESSRHHTDRPKDAYGVRPILPRRLKAEACRASGQMEEDGFVTRTVYPEVPPRVEYPLTELGRSLCAAFCGVWLWAETHYAQLQSLPKRQKTS